MDYLTEYIQIMRHRISELEVQVAVLRSMLPSPPPISNPTQPPHPQPKPKLTLVPPPAPPTSPEKPKDPA